MPALRVTVDAGHETQAPDELDADHAGLLVDAAQEDVTGVRLDGGPDHLDDLAHLVGIDHLVSSVLSRVHGRKAATGGATRRAPRMFPGDDER